MLVHQQTNHVSHPLPQTLTDLGHFALRRLESPIPPGPRNRLVIQQSILLLHVVLRYLAVIFAPLDEEAQKLEAAGSDSEDDDEEGKDENEDARLYQTPIPKWLMEDPEAGALLCRDVLELIQRALVIDKLAMLPSFDGQDEGTDLDGLIDLNRTQFENLSKQASDTLSSVWATLLPTKEIQLNLLSRLFSIISAVSTMPSGKENDLASAAVNRLLNAVLQALSKQGSLLETFFKDVEKQRSLPSTAATESKGGEEEKGGDEEKKGDEAESEEMSSPFVLVPAPAPRGPANKLQELYAKVLAENHGVLLDTLDGLGSGGAKTGPSGLINLLQSGTKSTVASIVQSLTRGQSNATEHAESSTSYAKGAVALLIALQQEVFNAAIAAPPKAAAPVASGETYTVSRFNSPPNAVGWGYGGTPDSIAFTVSQDVEITGVGLYGGSGGPYKVHLRLAEGNQVNGGSTLAEVNEEYEASTNEPAEVGTLGSLLSPSAHHLDSSS